MFKYIHPDMSTIPIDTDPKEKMVTRVVVEGLFVDSWLNNIYSSTIKFVGQVLVDDCDEFHFDAGGIMHKHEPLLEKTIKHRYEDLHGMKFTVFIRHAEILIKDLKTVMNHLEWLGPHVLLGGYWLDGIISLETASKLLNYMEEELKGRIGEADQLWEQHSNDMKKVGVRVPERKI